MKIGRVKTSLIIFWLSICILFAAFIWGITTSGYYPRWEAFLGISELSFVTILRKIISTCGLFYIPVAIIGCIGLSRKKDWGYWFSILSLILTILSTLWVVVTFFRFPDIRFFWEIAIPLIIYLVIVSVSSVIIIYLTKVRNRILQNEPQLLKKSKRLTIGLIFSIPIILIIGLIGYAITSYIIQDIVQDVKYQNEIRAELKQHEQLWNDNQIKDYKFRISIFYGGHIYGGHTMWEDWGGITSGGELESEFNIEIKDGIPVSVIDTQSGLPVALDINQSIDTIPELYFIIHLVLEGNIPEDIGNRINNSTELISINQQYTDIPFSIYSEYTDVYSFPKVISIFKKIEKSESYEIFYSVTYRISHFQPL